MSPKQKRGTKRTCQSCDARFYDLDKKPIICPMCKAKFVIKDAPPAVKVPVRRAVVVKPKPEAPPRVATDADNEGQTEIQDEDDLADIETDDVKIEADDDDASLENEKDGDTDVKGIIDVAVPKGGEES